MNSRKPKGGQRGNHVLVKSTLARIYAVGVMLLTAYLILVIACSGLTSYNTPSSNPPVTPATTPPAAPATIPATSEVIIAGFDFTPSTLNIPVGTTVTWRNNDSVTHTVTARDNSFDSGSISPGGTFTHTFEQKAAFEYFCKIHPSMTGKIIVQ